MTEVKTRKPRTKKANVEEKYNLQVPIAKEIEERLRELADELDLTLAQYARCVLIKHCKGENSQALFTSAAPVAPVGEQPTLEQESPQCLSTGEQTADKKKDTPKKPKLNKGLGSK